MLVVRCKHQVLEEARQCESGGKHERHLLVQAQRPRVVSPQSLLSVYLSSERLCQMKAQLVPQAGNGMPI